MNEIRAGTSVYTQAEVNARAGSGSLASFPSRVTPNQAYVQSDALRNIVE
jgi:hypothetical protein